MSDNVLYLGTSIPINYMIGSYPVMALYSGPSQIWSAKKPIAFVKAEGNWTQNINVFTSNKISDGQSTIEKVYFKNLGGKTITIMYDVDSESGYDYLTIFVLDSETEILATSRDNGTTNGDYGMVGSIDFTFPDNEEHFICLKYSKDGGDSRGRDNAIVTFPQELFGEAKWIVVGEVIRYEYENDTFYKCVYQDLQLSFNGVLTDTHKDGELISKEPTTATIISPDDTIKLDGISYGFWVPEVDLNKVYNLSFNYPTSITFGNPIKISSWGITTKDNLTEIRGLNFVDTSSVTDMSWMFGSCSKLTSLDLSSWVVSNVTNMSNMFYYCSSLTSLNLSSWDVSNVTNMSGMFDYCGSIQQLNLSGWDTLKVTNMSSMFSSCSSIQQLDLSSWVVSNVTDMNHMFYLCRALRQLNLSGWDTSKVTNMSSMFSSCGSLASLNLSGWDVSKVTNMGNMFDYCGSLTSLNLSSWDVSNVTNMGSMFCYCGSLRQLNLSGWDVSNVTGMGYMFKECNSLTSLDGLSGWDVSKVTNMGNMFGGCSSLASLDLSGWVVSNVTDMSSMFSSCGSLRQLNLSGWDVSKVTNMGHMFYSCSPLASLDLSGWNASNVTDMSYMFSNCKALTSLDLSGWNVSNVTDMSWMFGSCSKLTSLNLSGWDVSRMNYYDMDSTFSSCSALTTVIGPITGISTSISLKDSPLTHDSAMVFMNGLNTVTETKTITFKSTTYGTLTEAEIAAATAKGWTVKSAA